MRLHSGASSRRKSVLASAYEGHRLDPLSTGSSRSQTSYYRFRDACRYRACIRQQQSATAKAIVERDSNRIIAERRNARAAAQLVINSEAERFPAPNVSYIRFPSPETDEDLTRSADSSLCITKLPRVKIKYGTRSCRQTSQLNTCSGLTDPSVLQYRYPERHRARIR